MSSQPEDIFTWRTKEVRRWWFSGDPDETESFDDSNRDIREAAPGDAGASSSQGSIQLNLHRVYRQLNGMQR